MSEPYELGVAETARLIADRKLSVVELVETLLHRIDQLEFLKAWQFVDPDAVRADALQKQADLGVASATPSLFGVPVGLKDIFCTAGIPTTACSKIYADYVPTYDATSVTRVKEQGALAMGKTVTTEFAYRDPPPTLNPWNTNHTPGGSSSGSAVAVAAHMCAAAFGSQTRGSVLRPASYNGIVGLKPTFGRVSRYGVIPVSWSLDHVGWMTRSVEDAALLLQALAGPDPKDPVAAVREVPDYLCRLEKSESPSIGVLQGLFYDESDPEIRHHTTAVADRLEKAGAKVEVLPLPTSFQSASDDQLTIMMVEAASFHQSNLEKRADEYGPMLRDLLRDGLKVDAVTYSRALERRLRFQADAYALSRRADVLLTPTTPTPAPADLADTGSAIFQGPWTSCGLPTITIPSGLSSTGLPLGIQLIAAPFGEEHLLAAARWCEKQLEVTLTPPLD